MVTGFHDGDCSDCPKKSTRLNGDNLCIACADAAAWKIDKTAQACETEPMSMLIADAKSSIDTLESLGDGKQDHLDAVCTDAVDVIKKYEQLARDALSIQRDMRVELEYALEAFQENCQCNDCGPCDRQVAFERVLAAEKKIWGRLQEAIGKLA